MASNKDLKVSLIIDVDAKSGKASLRSVSGGLKNVQRSAKNAERSVGRLTNTLNTATLTAFGFNEITRALQQMGVAAERVVALQADWANLGARIKFATGSQEEANVAMARLVDIAQAAHAPLRSVGDLFARLAINVKRPKDELLDFTEAVVDSMLAVGTGTAEASGGLLQLSQALASGVLRGEEFNSVSEQMPLLLSAIEKQTGRSRAELRKMAEQGELTADLVVSSVLAMKDEWRAAAAAMPLTIGRAMTDLTTQFQQYVGQSESVQKATGTIAHLVKLLADNLDDLIPAIGTASSVALDLLLVFAGAKMLGAISNVGKLTARMKLLGKAIPAAFAVDLVLEFIGTVVEADKVLADIEKRRVTAAKDAADAIGANFAYRDIRVRTEAELAAMTTAEQKRYAEGLASADAYYKGLATQARQAGDTLRALSPLDALFDADGFSGGDELTGPVTEQALVYAKRLREIRAAIQTTQQAAGQRAVAESQFATRISAAMAQQKLAIKDAMQSAIGDYRAARSAAARAAADHKTLTAEYRAFADQLEHPVKADISFTGAANDLLDLKKLLRDGMFDEALAGADNLKDKLGQLSENAVGNDRGILAGIARDLADIVDKSGEQKEIIAQQDVDTAKARIQEVSDQAAALGFIHIGFDADASVADLQSRIEALSKELAKALVIPVTFKSGGGVRAPEIPGFSTGTVLAGYGGGDRRLALLEDGEGILRKEAVANIGPAAVHSINRLEVPRFSEGGISGGSAAPDSADPTATPVNLTIGGRTFRLSSARDQVNDLADAVRRVNRGAV